MKEYDVLIVGGGAAGLTAAIYTSRKKLKTAIISIDLGGQTLLTNHIENYPGVGKMAGAELMAKFQSQATGFGAEVIMGEVSEIKEDDKEFAVKLSNGEEYKGKAVIIASGKTARKLGIPGEDKFLGRGVSTCATCDANFFKGKVVAVVGGGNSALEAAELLNEFATKVYLIHRREEFRADEITVDKVKSLEKVEIITSHVPTKVIGDKFVEGLKIKDVNSGEEKTIDVDGVFVEIGYELKTDWLKDIIELNDLGEIKIDDRCRTSHPGIFAAGDVTSVPYKQTVISAGEGAKAGLEAYAYIKGGPTIDWH